MLVPPLFVSVGQQGSKGISVCGFSHKMKGGLSIVVWQIRVAANLEEICHQRIKSLGSREVKRRISITIPLIHAEGGGSRETSVHQKLAAREVVLDGGLVQPAKAVIQLFFIFF